MNENARAREAKAGAALRRRLGDRQAQALGGLAARVCNEGDDGVLVHLGQERRCELRKAVKKAVENVKISNI